MIHVTIWNEYRHEKSEEKIRAIYPEGIHGCIRDFLQPNEDFEVRTATLDDPDCGLPDEVLNDTDVLLWWGHMAHGEVPDELAQKIRQRVNDGMGFIALHSAHHSKPFRALMGTTCNLHWRDGDFERVWNIAPGHPITQGVDEYFELEREEMYGEIFDIPEPDKLIFMGWFSGGEVMRSGCCFYRGKGRVFYFQPGHESNPTYHHPMVQKVITNAVRWAAPTCEISPIPCPHVKVSPEALRAQREGK